MDPELIAYLDRRFDDLAERFDRQFEQVDRRFEQVDRRFEQVDRRFEQVDVAIRETRVLIEDLDSKVALVAEGVMSNAEAHRALRLEMDRQFEDLKAMNRLSYAELDRRLREHGL